MMRFFLAAWPSYWHDEYLSVLYYGANQKTVVGALRELAEKSVHPPLYQFILYYWVKLFGDTEVVTRTLSNLYVTGATLCLYIFTFKIYGRRVAIGAAIIFSLMFVSIKFAIETRSYAQSLFLVSLSSLILFYFLERLPPGATWRQTILSARFLYLVLVNLALLLTHYYNVFFLAAQGLFLLIYFLSRNWRFGIFNGIAKVGVITATPVILQFLIWGPVMAAMYGRFASRAAYVAEEPSMSPQSIFMQLVVRPNFGELSRLFLVLLFGLAVWLAIESYRRRAKDIGERAYFTLYCFIWAGVPCLMAFLLFFVAHLERYQHRYFIFCTPPLAILLVLMIEKAVSALSSIVSFTPLRPARHYIRYAMLYVMLVAVLVVVPEAQRAASYPKEDYKRIAKNVLAIVRSDPQHSYIIYEGNWRTTLNYYLSRFDPSVRVKDNFSPNEEKRGVFSFDQDLDGINQHDYLIVAFTHRRARGFPRALKRLQELYPIHFKQIDKDGRGLIVFKVGHSSPS